MDVPRGGKPADSHLMVVRHSVAEAPSLDAHCKGGTGGSPASVER